jgi:hypothetical protein
MTILEEISLQEAALRNHNNALNISLTIQLVEAVDLLKRIADNAIVNDALLCALVPKELIDEIQTITQP